MKVFCTKTFKTEFDKLIKSRSHITLENDIIEYFLNKEIADVSSGRRLNGSATDPFIKKRLDGKGGFRVYFLLIIKNEVVYLMFVHPKTGPGKGDNITDESKTKIYKEVLAAIQTDDLFTLSLSKEGKIEFKHN